MTEEKDAGGIIKELSSGTMVIPLWVVDWLGKAYGYSHPQTSIQFRPIFTFGRYDRTVPDKAST
jgi:hypothetical protein